MRKTEKKTHVGLKAPGIIKIPAQKWKMLVHCNGAGKTLTNWFPSFLTTPLSALPGPMSALMNHLCSGSKHGLWINQNDQNPSPLVHTWKMLVPHGYC